MLFLLTRAEVRQYHMEQRGNAIHRDPDWSLGKQTRLVTLREQHEGDSPEEAGRRPITKVLFHIRTCASVDRVTYL